MGAPFDVLVVDEAQDLSDRHTLDFFNLSIRGGLAGGQWALFGDFTRQALYGGAVDPVTVLSQRSQHFARARLTLNCRNSRRIAEGNNDPGGIRNTPVQTG